MNGSETLVSVRREDDLLFVQLDSPERANALAPAMIEEIIELYRRDWLSEGVRAMLLSGAGKHFSAGADLAHLRALHSAGTRENRRDSETLRALFEAVLRQPALTVAMVQGACVAGGCGLATAHDFVVAAEDARFLYSEVRIGFVAALVATFLPLRLRGADIRDVLLNPQFLSAGEAQRIGLVNRVVANDELATAARALTEEILANGSSTSIAATKHLLLDLVGKDLDSALDLAAEVNAAARTTADCKKGIAHVLEHKTPPRWR
jgi:methylglutaconyl-CoA hydratase